MLGEVKISRKHLEYLLKNIGCVGAQEITAHKCGGWLGCGVKSSYVLHYEFIYRERFIGNDSCISIDDAYISVCLDTVPVSFIIDGMRTGESAHREHKKTIIEMFPKEFVTIDYGPNFIIDNRAEVL